MSTHQHSPRSRRGIALKVALALALLTLALYVNRGQIVQVFRRPIAWRLFALGFVLDLLGVMLAYSRWFLMVRALGLPFRARDAARLGLIGTFFNVVIPGAIGGDFVKAAYLCREQPGRKTPAIASVVIDRLSSLLALFLLACGAGTLGWTHLDPPVRRLVVIAYVAAAVVGLILALTFSPALDQRLARRLRGRRRLALLLAELGATGSAYRRHPGVVALGVALGMATYSLHTIGFAAAGHALTPGAPDLGVHFLIVPLVLFSTAIPLPFGALGVSENVSDRLFRLVDYPGGVIAMLGFRTYVYTSAVLGAGVYLANLAQVRTLTATAAHLADDLQPEDVPTSESAVLPATGLPTSSD
ncbi:MAG TPA: lysylphosphatidylglycerol synthase transmembrane domain-containing protein [Isosphaeraceae bacterium]